MKATAPLHPQRPGAQLDPRQARRPPRSRRQIITQELLIPAVCIAATGSGVLSSTALLTAKVLPLVYGALPANLALTPLLACVLTALVVEIRAYDQLRRSRRPAWLMRLLGCYCAGLLWPYWIATPLIARLKRVRRKRPPVSRLAPQTTKPAALPDAPSAPRPASASAPVAGPAAHRVPVEP